jgi:superfamily II DNA or RNA helicase
MSYYQLKLGNVNSWLLTSDQEFKSFLNSKLKFREAGYFHSAAYKSGRWDGYKSFFDKNNGSFLSGLLPEIIHALKSKNKNYSIVDERNNNVNWLHKTIDENFLNNFLPEGDEPITLHDYQPDLVNKALFFNRGIIQAPTGAGKTFVAVSLLKCLPPKTPTLFLTRNTALVDQNYEAVKHWGIPDIGRCYGDYREPNFITFANTNVHSLKYIEKLLPKIKALIVDEVHECTSDVPISAYKKMKNACIRIGISATPFKDKAVHKFTVKGHFGPIFKTNTTESGYLTTKELQKRGILTKSICTFYPINEPTNIEYEPYIDAVTLGLEENFYFHKVIKKLDASLHGRTLILVERRAQGEYLKQIMPHAHWINGSDDIKTVRRPVMEALCKEKNTTAIVMRQIITAGIDIKIHNLINASGGDAEHNVVQQIGRGLRCANDKEKLKFYDFIFKNNPYLNKHSNNRIRTLEDQGHEIIIKDQLDF